MLSWPPDAKTVKGSERGHPKENPTSSYGIFKKRILFLFGYYIYCLWLLNLSGFSWLDLISIFVATKTAKRGDRPRQPWCQPRCFNSLTKYGTIGMGKSDLHW